MTLTESEFFIGQMGINIWYIFVGFKVSITKGRIANRLSAFKCYIGDLSSGRIWRKALELASALVEKTFASAYGVELIRRRHSNFVVNGDFQLQGFLQGHTGSNIVGSGLANLLTVIFGFISMERRWT